MALARSGTALAAALAALALALAGCPGASGPPRGPDYRPENSPEAATKCPPEAKAAKTARENALGDETREARVAAAQAIFAHADCEHRHFDAMLIEGVSPEDFKASVAAAKAQFYTAQNLYIEVTALDLPEWAVAGYARSGDLYATYAAKLRKSDPGPGISEGAGRAAWMAEIEPVAAPVEREAVDLYGKALDVVIMGPPPFAEEAAVAPYVKIACRGLEALAPARLDGYPPCRGLP